MPSLIWLASRLLVASWPLCYSLTWSAKIVDILGPGYTFIDTYRTRETTLRDALSHRTGLSALHLELLAGVPDEISRADFARWLFDVQFFCLSYSHACAYHKLFFFTHIHSLDSTTRRCLNPKKAGPHIMPTPETHHTSPTPETHPTPPTQETHPTPPTPETHPTPPTPETHPTPQPPETHPHLPHQVTYHYVDKW